MRSFMLCGLKSQSGLLNQFCTLEMTRAGYNAMSRKAFIKSENRLIRSTIIRLSLESEGFTKRRQVSTGIAWRWKCKVYD